MLKALQFALDLFSDMRLYDRVVTSYEAICFYELMWNHENYFYDNVTGPLKMDQVCT